MFKSLLDTLDTMVSSRRRDELLRRGQASAQLLMLHEIGKAMGGSLEGVERTHQLICEAVTVILQVERSLLFMIEERSGDLVARSGSGLITHSFIERLRIPAGEGVIADVVRTGRAVNLPNAPSHPKAMDIMRELGVRDVLMAPLRMENRVLGVILADSKLSGEAFTDDDLQLLTVLASLAAVTEENAALIERLRKKSARLNALLEVSQALNSTLQPDDLLDLILSKAMELTRASGGSVILLDPKTQRLNIVAAKELSPNTIKNLKLNVGQGITGWVAREKLPLLVKDVSLDSRYIQANDAVRSELAVPLLRGDELIGVINMDAFEVAAFDEDDEALLQTLAAVASTAIHNARLFANLSAGQKGEK